MRRKSLPVFSMLPLLVLVILLVVGFFVWQRSSYGRFDRFNLVLATHPVTLVSLDRTQKTATVVSFPDDLYVSEVVPRLGGYKMAQVYKVGELDHRGGLVLSWTVGELLGIPVDGYLFRETQITGGVKNFFVNPGTFLGSSTNLSFWDLGQFIYTFLQIRADRVKLVDLGKMSSPLLLADGSQAQGVDKELLDNALTGDFLEEVLTDEKLRVEVVNSTTAPGLGARVARKLSNVGVTVVSVSTMAPEQAGCEVRTEKKNMAKLTVLRLAAIWQCKIAESGQDRADVSLVLGTDLASKF